MYDSKVFEEPRKTKEVLSLDCAIFGLDAWDHYNVDLIGLEKKFELFTIARFSTSSTGLPRSPEPIILQLGLGDGSWHRVHQRGHRGGRYW